MMRPSLLSLLLLCLVIQGCSYIGIRDKSDDYRDAKPAPRIQVPEKYDDSSIVDAYPISGDLNNLQFEGEAFEVPRPESKKSATGKHVRAFRSGQRYWIAVDDSPSSAWARVRRFWDINGIQLADSDPNKGMIETNWLSRKEGEAITQNRFRMQVEVGMREDTADIELQHIGFPDGTELPEVDDLSWGTANQNPDLSLSIMKEIAAFLLETEYEAGSASLLAQNLLGTPKSSLEVGTSGEPVLVLRLDYDRAWDAVQTALASAAIGIEDQDRTAGVYYLAITEEKEEKKKRWYSFLSFGGDKEPEAVKAKLTLETKADRIEVRAEGQADSPEGFSQALLSRLRNNLI